jgi:glutamate racemase
LTVVKELLRRHPDAVFEYLGDTARTPYGTKGPETILRYATEDAAYLVSRGADTIIVACNTASAHALPALRERFPNVVFHEVISPAIKAVLDRTNGHVGVIGTCATIRSGIYETALMGARPDIRVISGACPLFVPLVEEGWLDGDVARLTVERYLRPMKEQGIDTLVLGCTHYPLLRPLIAAFMGPGVAVIDAPSAILDALDHVYAFKPGTQRYAFTDVRPGLQELTSSWLERPVHPELVRLA